MQQAGPPDSAALEWARWQRPAGLCRAERGPLGLLGPRETLIPSTKPPKRGKLWMRVLNCPQWNVEHCLNYGLHLFGFVRRVLAR